MSDNDSLSSANAKIRIYDLFMLALCVYVLIALAVDALVPLREATSQILQYADNAICLIFLADFAVRLVTAESKTQYLKWGWIDLISSIPMIDAFRAGRLLRLMRVIRLLRAVRSTKALLSVVLAKRAESAFTTTLLASIILLSFSSIAILHCEKSPEANIRTAEDALWWSFVTITTVGYGDKVPLSTEGHVIAAFLMAAGVGLFGTFTGLVASWFLAAGEEEQSNELEEIRSELADLKALVKDLADRSR